MSVSGNLFGQVLFVGGVFLIFYGLSRVDHATYALAGAVLTGASYLGLILGEVVSRLGSKKD